MIKDDQRKEDQESEKVAGKESNKKPKAMTKKGEGGLRLEIEAHYGMLIDKQAKNKKTKRRKKKKTKEAAIPMSLWKCLRGRCFEKAGHHCEACGEAPPVNRLVCHQVKKSTLNTSSLLMKGIPNPSGVAE